MYMCESLVPHVVLVCKWILKYATNHHSRIPFSSLNPVILLASFSVGFHVHSRTLTFHVQWSRGRKEKKGGSALAVKKMTVRESAPGIMPAIYNACKKKKKKNASIYVIATRYYVI